MQKKKKKKKGDGFLLFSKAFSWEIDLWVTLGGFTVKTQNWEGKSVLSENWLSRNEMWCAADNYNYVSHMCERIFRFKL